MELANNTDAHWFALHLLRISLHVVQLKAHLWKASGALLWVLCPVFCVSCMLCVVNAVCPVYVVWHKSDNKPGAAALPLTRPPNVGFDQATSRKRDDGKAKNTKHFFTYSLWRSRFQSTHTFVWNVKNLHWRYWMNDSKVGLGYVDGWMD